MTIIKLAVVPPGLDPSKIPPVRRVIKGDIYRFTIYSHMLWSLDLLNAANEKIGTLEQYKHNDVIWVKDFNFDKEIDEEPAGFVNVLPVEWTVPVWDAEPTYEVVR